MSVSVILLAHNEAATIAQEIRAFYDAIVRRIPGAELIVAEDGSRDGTREVIMSVAAEIALRLVGAAERLGYGRAVSGAVKATDKPWVFLCDGGLKHDPNDFWRLWNVRDQYDLVAGRKTGRKDHLHRRILTFGYNFLIRQIFGYEVFDADSGMRLMSRRVADEIVGRGPTFGDFTSSEFVVRAIAAGFRYGEVPISYRQRVGESRGMPASRIRRAVGVVIRDLIRLRRELQR